MNRTNRLTHPQAAIATSAPPYSIDFPPSLVREAVGLDTHEKAFLFLLASHKNMKSTRSREAVEQSIGFKGNRIYAVTKKLLAKKLIQVFRGPIGAHTVYKLDKHALLRWVEDPDAALLWERNDRAFLQDDARKPVRAHRLGDAGVRELQKRRRLPTNASTTV